MLRDGVEPGPMYKPARLGDGPMRRLGYIVKVSGHLEAAKSGDRDRESRLVTRVGELRADFPTREAFKAWAEEDPELLELLREAFRFFQSVGRAVDLKNADQARWISARGGSPRRF